GRKGEVFAQLRALRDRYADQVRAGFPQIPRRVSGYNLDDLLPERGFNVARALVGSEGTCAMVLEASVRLVDSPPKRTLVVVGYPDIGAAGDDVAGFLEYGPIGLEFFDATVVDHLHAKGMHFWGEGLLPEGRNWLLVEFGGPTQEASEEPARALMADLSGRTGAPPAKLYDDKAEEAAVWEVRRHSVGSTRMPAALGGHPGWANWEDAAVPPARLGDYLRDQVGLLDRFGYHGVFYGHFGQGCVHCRIDFDLRSATGVGRFRSFVDEAADLVCSYGGSLSGEHGDGHGRAELWPKMFGSELMPAFGEFKALWDPRHRMNPGKLVEPYRIVEHLREGPDYTPVQVRTHFSFTEDDGDFSEAAGRCFGVGKCRHLAGGTMCPSFMVTREEKHSTRGRARLLYELLREPTEPLGDGWRSEEVKDALDLCLACKGCKGDCPVKVDMATYKAEFLSHYYAGRLRPRSAYALGLIPLWARMASLAPRVVNQVSHHPSLGPLVKALGGVAPERRLPSFAPSRFTRWFRGHRQPTGGTPVVVFPDTFTEFFRPGAGIAATRVLEDAGFRVELPRAPVCCGRPLYDYGMLDLAERFLRRNLDVLGDQVRAGMPVVVLEPSCAAVFRDELPNLMPRDQDARRLASQTVVLSELLGAHDDSYRPPRLDRRALVQAHCHEAAVMGTTAEARVLADMGLEVDRPDSGCCGMAGSFGYEAGDHYQVSEAAGERVILPAVRQADPETLVVADGFSCQEQIAQGSGRRALHLAEVLSLAREYGPAGPPGRPEDALGGPTTAAPKRGALAALGAAGLAGAAQLAATTRGRRSR
ncbi:MAG TPA: FAD-linked oxidase C-terminal domain-containing protein, partial [Acidimicrobiales bacterium]|nr:FAD-linked oxidase C-terminal domain-containing protein [Acidimicrobiales bacterium]